MTEQMRLFPGVENLVLNSKVSRGTSSALVFATCFSSSPAG